MTIEQLLIELKQYDPTDDIILMDEQGFEYSLSSIYPAGDEGVFFDIYREPLTYLQVEE